MVCSGSSKILKRSGGIEKCLSSSTKGHQFFCFLNLSWHFKVVKTCGFVSFFPCQVAEQTFSYAVSEECDQVFGGKWCLGDDGLKPSRTVMVLSWGKLQAAIQTLEQMLSQRT